VLRGRFARVLSVDEALAPAPVPAHHD
jgi:hypothetical protein